MPPYRIDFIDRTNHMSRPAEIVEYTGDFEAIQKGRWIAMTWSFGKEVALLCDFLTTRNSKG